LHRILVLGHKNPDNDSISSAVAYAYLKGQLNPDQAYEAVRLGPLPHETRWVFERYGVEAPAVIPHLFSRVSDVMTSPVISVPINASLLEAGRRMRDSRIRALVVTELDGTYHGLFTTRMLAEIFISELDSERTRQDTLADSVEGHLDRRALTLKPEALLKDVIDDVLSASLREAVVLDDENRCIGIITRSNLARPPRRRVILVDHNEASQSAAGIMDADVVGIVDHHRIGDIQTITPIQFINLPVGSTATIVTLEFQRYKIEIPRHIAAVLLSAVMTDTVLLKSPTCTPIDHQVAAYLGELVGVDALQFGIELFGSRDAASPPTIEAITGTDAKEFEVADKTVLIAQYETVSLASILKHETELISHLEKKVAERGYEFALLLVTDVIAEGSQLLLAGNPRVVERAFDVSFAKGSVWIPGILSRKKQVAPRVLEHA
jgi:manganese-dependent inorganic pyrophosphatase